MSTLKVIEILAECEQSWEDAAANAVEKAAQTLHNVKSICVKEMDATVEDGKIASYPVNAKISVVLE